MNQFNWTYLGQNGKNHNVGMYHGADSGHLLVYCNSKIILVDFSVLKSSTYSFFIEEELCELEIELRNEKFYYGFHLNKTADTPLNRRRKKTEKKYLYQSLAFLGAVFIVVMSVFLGINHLKQDQQTEGITTLLQEFGEEAEAKILIASENEDHSVSYYFIVNGRGYTVQSKQSEERVQLYQHGMPLEKGDEFVIRYLPENPNTCSIDYSRPTPQQIETYLRRAAYKYVSRNPEATEDEGLCLTKIAYDLKGVDGLADFYYQDLAVEENPKHNIESFQRLVRDIPFQQERQKRCGLLN
ncbi:MAG: hypothetical protein AB8F74_23665 [Saprospiraceae bacterium]